MVKTNIYHSHVLTVFLNLRLIINKSFFLLFHAVYFQETLNSDDLSRPTLLSKIEVLDSEILLILTGVVLTSVSIFLCSKQSVLYKYLISILTRICTPNNLEGVRFEPCFMSVSSQDAICSVEHTHCVLNFYRI